MREGCIPSKTVKADEKSSISERADCDHGSDDGDVAIAGGGRPDSGRIIDPSWGGNAGDDDGAGDRDRDRDRRASVGGGTIQAAFAIGRAHHRDR